MNIFLTLRCGHNDSANFIKQFSELEEVKRVFVFRDTAASILPKVTYVSNLSHIIAKLNFLIRFWQIIIRRKYYPKAIVGIYEIPHGLIAVLAGKALNVPSVVSIIGNPAYTKIRKGIRMKLTSWILHNAFHVTVTGNNSKSFLISKGFPEAKISVLPNTLDFTYFNIISSVEKKYDLISLGRISNEKHIEVIVKVVSLLKQKLPAIRVAIAGTGAEIENIRALVKTLNLEENIVMPGYIADAQLEDFFNSGRVFILTSETEGFPRTIIQAAACGVPVIASNVGDITDVIDNEHNGFLVNDYQNVDEYAERVLQLLNDEEMYNAFAGNLNRKVRKEFVNEKASEVWKSILGKITVQIN